MTITDKLKYYIGAKCVEEYSGKPFGIIHGVTNTKVSVLLNTVWVFDHHEIKPILKRLQDMTEEEMKELVHLKFNHIGYYGFEHMYGNWQGIKFWGKITDNNSYPGVQLWDDLNAAQFHYLLSKQYWLFEPEAFEEGLVIDEKTLEK